MDNALFWLDAWRFQKNVSCCFLAIQILSSVPNLLSGLLRLVQLRLFRVTLFCPFFIQVLAATSHCHFSGGAFLVARLVMFRGHVTSCRSFGLLSSVCDHQVCRSHSLTMRAMHYLGGAMRECVSVTRTGETVRRGVPVAETCVCVAIEL